MISEAPANWVDSIGPDGRLRYAVHVKSVHYASDPQPLPHDHILLADYGNPGQVIVINRAGRVLLHYGPKRGHGRLDHPSLAIILPNGNIAVNDDFRCGHRPTPQANSLAIRPQRPQGRGAGYLNTPDGMDFVPVDAAGAPNWAAVKHPGSRRF